MLRADLKTTVFSIYVAGAIALSVWSVRAVSPIAPDSVPDLKPGDRVLDKHGPAGPVVFNHPRHEGSINPDPADPHRARAGAACAGCHHTMSLVPKAEQLRSCSVCHRERGNERNPRSQSADEMWVKAAYHRMCIGCHTASHKGPTACGDCHRKAEA